MLKTKKLILIHGLNNNLEAFLPLKTALEARGFECEQIILPGHGDDREETKNSDEARKIFDSRMRAVIDERPYGVIAFSQGALYLQLWLEETSADKPTAQILLAPALFIRNARYLNFVLQALPKFFIIMSQMPKILRRYDYLYIWEYRNLFLMAKTFEQKMRSFKVATKILVDEKDELVDAQRLNQKFPQEVELINRPYLKGKKPGKYHILFQPDYFNQADWNYLIQTIAKLLD